MIPQIPDPGVHTLYYPLPLSVGGTCEYGGIAAPWLDYVIWQMVLGSYSFDYVNIL